MYVAFTCESPEPWMKYLCVNDARSKVILYVGSSADLFHNAQASKYHIRAA